MFFELLFHFRSKTQLINPSRWPAASAIYVAVVLVGLLTPGRMPTEASISPAASGWDIIPFPSGNDQGAYTSLALDQEGFPHISFLDETSFDVSYIHWDGNDWLEDTADTLTFLAWSNTSLALDGSDRPQIVYPFANPCSMGHAQWDGSEWQLTKLDIGGCAEYALLALDGSGEPCISYYAWSSSGARILAACRESTGWQGLGVVDTVHYSFIQDQALYHGLVRGSDGTPHLSYYRQILSGPAQLWHATRSNGSWDKTLVDAGPGVGGYSSIALDGQNYPHISYYDQDNGDLKYAQWSGGQWVTDTVDSPGDVGKYTSLALDGSGNPHISYYDVTNADLKYAYWGGGQWHIETVDDSGDAGRWNSLKLDGAGKAHISYFDETNKDLKYATNSGSSGGLDPASYLPLIARPDQ